MEAHNDEATGRAAGWRGPRYCVHMTTARYCVCHAWMERVLDVLAWRAQLYITSTSYLLPKVKDGRRSRSPYIYSTIGHLHQQT